MYWRCITWLDFVGSKIEKKQFIWPRIWLNMGLTAYKRCGEEIVWDTCSWHLKNIQTKTHAGIVG